MKTINPLLKCVRQFVIAVGALFVSFSVFATPTIVLELQGIEGDVEEHGINNGIRLLSWAEGLSNPAAPIDGSTRRAGTPVPSEITVTKLIDRTSPLLRHSVATGTPIPTATIYVRRNTGDRGLFNYFQIDLKDVIVTSVAASGQSDGAEVAENLSLNFVEIKWIYREMNPDGSTGEVVERSWNFRTNEGG